MTNRFFAIGFIFLLGLSHPTFLLGQIANQQQDWKTIEGLSSGVKLSVETKDGKKIKGKFGSTSTTTLSLNGNNGPIGVNKDDIKKVYQLGGGSRAKSAIIGTAVGAGVGVGGAAVALAATGGSDSGGTIIAQGLLIGAGIGALFGVLAGKSSQRTLIYESK